MELAFLHGADDHTHARSVVGDRVNEDEGACRLVVGIGVEEEFLGADDHGTADFVEFQMVNLGALKRVDVHLVVKMVDAATAGVGRLLEVEAFLHVHGLFVHPDEHGLEVASHVGHVVGVDNHFAA